MKAPGILTAVLALMVSGCSLNQPPVRIGLDDWPPCAVWSVAEKQGFLFGLRVEFIHYTNWSDSMEALYKGKLDLTHSTYLNTIFYNGRGEPSRILLSLDTIAGGDGLVLSNKVLSPRDLSGRRIAVEVDTDEHFLLYKALASFGVPSESVKIVSATSKDAMELFKAGKVDACFTYDPYLTEAAASGLGRIVWTTKDAPGFMIDVLVARQALVSDRKDETAKLVEAWFKARAFIEAQPAVAYPVMAASLNMKLEDFVPFYEGFESFGIERNRTIFASKAFSATLGEMSEFLVREKAVASNSAVEKLFDASFVRDLVVQP